MIFYEITNKLSSQLTDFQINDNSFSNSPNLNESETVINVNQKLLVEKIIPSSLFLNTCPSKNTPFLLNDVQLERNKKTKVT